MKGITGRLRYYLVSIVFFTIVYILLSYNATSLQQHLGMLVHHAIVWVVAHAPFLNKKLDFREFIGLEFLFTLFVYLCYFLGLIDVLFMPVIGFALLVAMLFSPLISNFMSFSLVLYAMQLHMLDVSVISAYMLVSASVPITIGLLRQRVNFIISGIINGILMYLVVIAGANWNFELRQGYAALNGLVSPILAIGITPIMESLFGILSPVKLMELSNPSKELLKRLMTEAPGTYQHSMLVGSLAESAASQIGADALLARVGSYYHDVGKLFNPTYFVENQTGMENPHDNMTPEESADCLRGHVIKGVELLKKHRLPRKIIDFALTHHGDSQMIYFYHRAKQLNPDADIKRYSYPGPRPRTREEAIVMFADCVEAATRADKTRSKREIIQAVIAQKISEDQLSECPLTFREVKLIKQAFENVLTATNHERVSYPDAKQ